MNLEELAQELISKQRARRFSEKAIDNGEEKNSISPNTWATELGWQCDRRIVYRRVWPHLAEQISEELASIFYEGDLHETDVRRELSLLGYELVENQVRFGDDRLEISGMIDGKLQIKDKEAPKGRRRIPTEIKGLAGGIPKNREAWEKTDSALLKRYECQMQIYLFLTEEELGLMIFKDKMTGLWTPIPVSLDYERAESLLQKAELVRDSVALVKEAQPDETTMLEMFPDRLADRSECARCPYYTHCLPADADVDPILVTDDKELHGQLVMLEGLQDSRDEYEKIDKSFKQRFKMTKGNEFVVGVDFRVIKKPHGKGVRVIWERIGDEA